MASLLERMNIDVPATSVGPVRTKPKRATPTPYVRPVFMRQTVAFTDLVFFLRRPATTEPLAKAAQGRR